ncbi:hypothetical protein GOODEAATRI_000288, partial [Goodea atripinnis]
VPLDRFLGKSVLKKLFFIQKYINLYSRLSRYDSKRVVSMTTSDLCGSEDAAPPQTARLNPC